MASAMKKASSSGSEAPGDREHPVGGGEVDDLDFLEEIDPEPETRDVQSHGTTSRKRCNGIRGPYLRGT